MKKLSFLLLFMALSLVSTTTFAQEVKDDVKAIVEEVQEKVEIKLSELPEAVTKVLGEEFTEHTAEKAYKVTHDDQETFHVKLEKEGAYTMVHFDAEGKILGQEDIDR